MILNNSFNGRSIFVTGHTGFKGSWLTLWLHRLGAKVTGYSLAPPTDPSHFAASRVKDLLERHYEADVRDGVVLDEAVERCRPEVIFHLAAQTLVPQSYRTPLQTFDANAMGTAILLDCVRKLRRPCVVIMVTSDKCYENSGSLEGRRESDPLGGHDPYSASKAAAELLINSYRRSFFSPSALEQHGVKVASVRAGNVIGGGDWAADRIVPDMVRALSIDQPVPVRNPGSIRPWQHVLEPLSGYLTLASRMLTGEDPELCSGWNFGPAAGSDASVRNLVEKFCDAWGSGRWRDASSPGKPYEDPCLRLCIEKAARKLHWQPRWNFAEAVRRTCRWYRSFYASPSQSTYGLCLDDITDYEAAMVDESCNSLPQPSYAHAQ